MKRKIKLSTVSIRVRRNVNIALKFVEESYGRYCAVMLDLRDGEIWADAFIDYNQFKKYLSSDIVVLGYIRDGYDGEGCKRFMVQHAIDYFDEYGWEILS